MNISKREQKAIESKFDQLVKAAQDVFFTLEGTPQVNVRRANGEYRRKVVPTDISYQFAYAYYGTKGGLIIGMRPEDARDFEAFEVEVTKLDAYIPMMATELSAFTKLEQPIERLDQLFNNLAQTALIEHREAEARAQEAILKNYNSNNDFGAF